MAPPKVSEWGGESARGLAAAHARGLVHGDLKPDQFITRDDHGERSHRAPQVLPSGKAVLVTVLTGAEGRTSSIGLQSLVTGERRTIVDRANRRATCPVID